MGLEVTVLVVLLSRCSYMTAERERNGERESWRVGWRMKSKRNGRRTGPDKGDRWTEEEQGS